MTKRNTQGRRDAEARARKIQAAEEAAQRAHAKALARVEAEGLWASVEKANAARLPVEAHLLALQEDMVRHFRACAGRLAEPWPHSEALRAAESRSRTFEAVFGAVFEKYIRVMNADEYTLRRPLFLKAAAQDVARAARVGGGKARGAKVKAEGEQLRKTAAEQAAKLLAEEPGTPRKDLPARLGYDRKTLMRRRRPVR